MSLTPYAITPQQYKVLVAQPLSVKIALAQAAIHSAYEWAEGNIYVSISGKDSTVLLHLVRALYPDTPAVFSDTGLEFPEIRAHIKTLDNVIWVKPQKTFKDVIQQYGYPIISKNNARYLRDLQSCSILNEATRTLRLTGIKRDGSIGTSTLPKKYVHLINAPFKISEQCCKFLKEGPLSQYAKDTKALNLSGVRADESYKRKKDYLRTGCNAFKLKRPHSHPISLWSEQDVWNYVRLYNVPYATIYDKGERRTGCVFCGFGVHLEQEPNRVQRLRITHPKLWEYCIYKLGWKEVWEYLNVPYM